MDSKVLLFPFNKYTGHNYNTMLRLVVITDFYDKGQIIFLISKAFIYNSKNPRPSIYF
jgi:hypothetical protein